LLSAWASTLNEITSRRRKTRRLFITHIPVKVQSV
jgi:hypothetical protein